MGLADERLEVAKRPVGRIDAGVVGDVVAVVAHRRGVEGQEPESGHSEVAQVVELLGQPAEVAAAVAVAVAEGPDVDLVDDRVAVPRWVVRRPGLTAPRPCPGGPGRGRGDGHGNRPENWRRSVRGSRRGGTSR
jgi:hypothetical protein